MALGHDRQQQMKKAKNVAKRSGISGVNKSDNDTAQRNIISAKSSDSELDSIKVTEMLDSITGGLADVQISQPQDRDDKLELVVKGDSSSQVANNVDIITKSARKRAALKNKKRSLVTTNEISQVNDASLVNPSMNDESAETQQIPRDEPQATQGKSVTTSKKPKQKFSKEEKAEYRARKEKSAITPHESSDRVQPAVEVESLVTELSDAPLPVPSKVKAKKKKPSKKHSPSVSTPALPASTVDYAQSSTIAQAELASKLQSSTFVPADASSDDQNITTKTNTPVTQKHNRHKSMDIRLRLNGQKHKTLIVDSPLDAPSSPSKTLDKQPLKIKLPGRDVTFVYPEEFSRGSSRGSRGRSHATSISSQFSGLSTRGGHEMRSRQSSHTTVGTNGALENKLQNMILSHATDPAANDSTASLVSEPATRSSRCLSPIVLHSSSQSAPPMNLSQSGVKQHSSSQSLPSMEQDVIPREVSDNLGMAIPAVPTVFEARPSQLHAPPSLGPPQPQNLPEQIPKPYQGSHSSQPSSHYNSNFPMQNPYYNYYSMPQQMYNPYPTASPGLPMPYYEHPMPSNGMVYYNPDGSQVYPQEYYQYPPLFMNPYQQQHYEY